MQYMEERKPRRFVRTERVVCQIGKTWASGLVAAVNEVSPEDASGQTILPYVVKLDPPKPRLISVPEDDQAICRAEVCFGSRPDALSFSLYCLPPTSVAPAKRRFSLGERVVCARLPGAAPRTDCAWGEC